MNQLIKYNEHMEVTYDVILLNKDKPKLIGYSDLGGSSINTNYIAQNTLSIMKILALIKLIN